MKFREKNLTPFFGKELIGADFNLTETKNKIRSLLYESELLVIRNQDLSEEGLIRLAKVFGEILPFGIKQYRHPDFPEILVTSNEKKGDKPLGVARVGTFWHSDSSYLANPAEVTMLHGKVTPNIGGETKFLSMRNAYERLPENLQKKFQLLTAKHTIKKRYKVTAQDIGRSITEIQHDLEERIPDVTHELVKAHTHTKKHALYFSEGYTSCINANTENESKLLFELLNQICTDESYVYTHKWQKNDILIWDNRSVNHMASPSPEARTLFRISVKENNNVEGCENENLYK